MLLHFKKSTRTSKTESSEFSAVSTNERFKELDEKLAVKVGKSFTTLPINIFTQFKQIYSQAMSPLLSTLH